VTGEKSLVSIGLPVYNGDAYVKLALDSLADQTYENLEVIISDNGSTDDTPDICRAYAEKYDFMKYFGYEENRGLAWNRNNAFHLASGEYFMWFSHDDLIHKEYVAKCVAAINAREDTCIVYSKIEVIDSEGQTIPFDEDLPDLDVDDVVERFWHCLSPQRYNQSVIFGLIRRSDMASTPLHGDYVAADRCLVARLSLKGKIYQVPEILFFRRKHIDNIGSTIDDMKVYQPGVKFKVVFPEWNVLKHHLISVHDFQGPITVKFRLCAAVFRWFLSRPRIFFGELAHNVKKILILVFRRN
jgi:glycosyltransferase involved in cell wall biosynthesis